MPTRKEQYAEELQEAVGTQAKNSNFIKSVMHTRKKNFGKGLKRAGHPINSDKEILTLYQFELL